MTDHSKHHLLTREEIARLAHEMYLLEGKPEGREMDHWLAAEQALLKKKAKQQDNRVLETKTTVAGKAAPKPTRKSIAKRRVAGLKN